MAIDLQTVKDLKASLDDEYGETHRKFRKLRDVYHGRYWELAEQESQARSITSIFRDIGRSNRTSMPPIRIVRNIIHEVAVKYQTYLSPVPMVNYYTDAPETDERRQQMSVKERYTYGVWRAGQMSRVLNNVAWYQPLMGDAFIGIYPDTKLNLPVPILRSPEHAFPLKGFGGSQSTGHIFHWKETLSTVKRTFPEHADQIVASLGRITQGRGSDPLIEIYEYSDVEEFARWAGPIKVNGVEHNFGFDLFAHAKFIDVPGETFGHSAVEQAVQLNEADNMIYSLLFQAMIENIFPTIVLTDPAKAPEEIMKGPGAIIPLNPGGRFDVIAPPVQAVQTQLEYLANNKQSIQEATGMPGVNFGQSPATSIVTGAAVNALQGAGTGSTVEMVQGGLGLVMSQWCEKAIYMQQKMWPNDKVTLNYVSPLTRSGGKAERGTMTVKGSDLVGGTANEIVWSPAMDIHDKLVMWLQAKGAGLVSDQYILKQIGIPDPQAMQDELFQEEMDRAVLGFMVSQLAQPTPDSVAPVEEAAIAFLEGTGRVHVPGVTPPGMPPPPVGGALPAGAPQPGVPPQPPGPGGGFPGPAGVGPFAGGTGTVKAPPLPLPPGAPAPVGSKIGTALGEGPIQPGSPGAAPEPVTAPATVNTVVRALSGATYAGRVWLVGEIAVKGSTTGAIDVAVTDPADRQVVAGQAPQFQFRFHVVQGVPAETAIEVTGG